MSHKDAYVRLAEAYYHMSHEIKYSHVAQHFWLERSWLCLVAAYSGVDILEIRK